MNSYLPVLIVLLIGSILGAILSALAAILGPKKLVEVDEQADPWECGMTVKENRDKMSVKFFLTAILFILFDIETIFLYLWARSFDALGWFGLIEVFVFLAVLVAGYIYVLKSKALDWE